MINKTHMDGFSYAMDRLHAGDNPSVHELVQDYKHNDLPLKYQWTEMDKCSQDFEQGVRTAFRKYKK